MLINKSINKNNDRVTVTVTVLTGCFLYLIYCSVKAESSEINRKDND